MAGAGRWASLLLCLLHAAPGRPRLAPPQNVSLVSYNFTVDLTWLPGPGNPPNVTYFVGYRRYRSFSRWYKVKSCAGTRELVCSMMCLENQDLFNKFKGRVRAASPSAKSPWAESKPLEYLNDVELAPPTLQLTQKEESLKVNATFQLPPCQFPLSLKYEVEFWKNGTGKKISFLDIPYGQPVWIPLHPAASGLHCLHARTVYTLIVSKFSKFSKPTCFFLEARGTNPAFLVLPSLLPPLLVIATGGMIWKSLGGNPWFQRAKMPQSLVFSGPQCLMATLQPSVPECLESLLLCPQKEVTRRIRQAPAGQASGSLQAGPGKPRPETEEAPEHSESSEEDDDACFQLYIGAAPFLRQEPQTTGPPEEEEEESGLGSGETSMPLISSEGASTYNSSGRSWASTADSSLWDKAGSSGYTANRDLEPGRTKHQEPLSPGSSQASVGPLAESPEDGLCSWTTWGSPPPLLGLIPEEPPVSLRTLMFCWDSSPEEEEEEEEEEEDNRESETEISWVPETRGTGLGHYMARSAGPQLSTKPGVAPGFEFTGPQQDLNSYIPR